MSARRLILCDRILGYNILSCDVLSNFLDVVVFHFYFIKYQRICICIRIISKLAQRNLNRRIAYRPIRFDPLSFRVCDLEFQSAFPFLLGYRARDCLGNLKFAILALNCIGNSKTGLAIISDSSHLSIAHLPDSYNHFMFRNIIDDTIFNNFSFTGCRCSGRGNFANRIVISSCLIKPKFLERNCRIAICGRTFHVVFLAFLSRVYHPLGRGHPIFQPGGLHAATCIISNLFKLKLKPFLRPYVPIERLFCF